jgi:excisionase family DNA binding protein
MGKVQAPHDDALLTTADAARRLNLTPNAVRVMESKGRIPATRTASGQRLFREADVAAVAAARAKAASLR